MKPTLRQKMVRIRDLIPSQWKAASDKSQIWLTGYRGHGTALNDIGGTAKIIDLKPIKVRVIAFHGSLPYPVVELKTRFDAQGRLQMKRSDEMEESKGLHFLFVAPSPECKTNNLRRLKPEGTPIAVSLVAALCGRSAVFQHLFDQEISLESSGAKWYSPHIENPLSLDIPDVTLERLEQVVKAAETIARLPETDRNKVYLSLRWFNMGFGEIGVEGFLKYWIALEALSMKTTNIRPIQELLSKAYQMSVKSAEEAFQIGRLFGLRSKIVHEGQLIPLHFAYLRYIEALYYDLFRQRLGFECERKAGRFLEANRRHLSILFGHEK